MMATIMARWRWLGDDDGDGNDDGDGDDNGDDDYDDGDDAATWSLQHIARARSESSTE